MASTGRQQPDRAFRQQLTTVFLSRTALNTAHRIIYPFLPTIARGLGISLQAASGIVALRVVAGIGAPFLGLIADRYGRQRTMIVGLLVFAVASFLLAGTGAFVAATIAFALFGLAKILYDTAVYAYVGDTVTYKRRGRAIGFIELSWSAAWLLGVPASGFLIQRFGWRAPWAALSVLGVVGAWLTHSGLQPARNQAGFSPLVQPTSHSGQARYFASLVATWRELLRRRSIAALLLTSFLLTLANEIPFIVYGAWLETTFGLSLTTLGLASMAVGLAEAAAELATTVITDRLGKRQSVLVGLLCLAASLSVLPTLSELGLAGALASIVLMMLTFEFSIVSLIPLATELAPDTRASLLALNITALSLGRVLGSVVGGWLWQWRSIFWHAAVGASIAVMAALILAWGLKDAPD